MSQRHNINPEAFASRLTGFGFSNSDLSFVGLALNFARNEDDFRNVITAQFNEIDAGNIIQAAQWATSKRIS